MAKADVFIKRLEDAPDAETRFKLIDNNKVKILGG
jgi:hypothetical protein